MINCISLAEFFHKAEHYRKISEQDESIQTACLRCTHVEPLSAHHFVYPHSVHGNPSAGVAQEYFKPEIAVPCLLQSQTFANKPHQACLGRAIRITSVFLLEMKSPLLAANICIFLHLDYLCRIQQAEWVQEKEQICVPRNTHLEH